jgi:hypothetical protein
LHFWPFDGWPVPSAHSAVAEVYPALWSRSFANDGRSADQHDAYSIAAWMREADLDGRLSGFLDPSLSAADRSAAKAEGWILGIK